MDYMPEESWFDSWGGGGEEIFLLSTASILALRPNHPPVQWVLGLLSLGV
jgi:hypothetical protein